MENVTLDMIYAEVKFIQNQLDNITAIVSRKHIRYKCTIAKHKK